MFFLNLQESTFNLNTPTDLDDNDDVILPYNNLKLLPQQQLPQQHQHQLLSEGKLLLKKRRQTEPLSLPSVSGATKMGLEGE